jgi:hypothetical protein
MQCIPKFLTKRYTGDCYQYPLGNPEREELEGEREREREREKEEEAIIGKGCKI